MCIPVAVAGRVTNLDISELDGMNFDETSWQAEICCLFGLVTIGIHGTGLQPPNGRLRLGGWTKQFTDAFGSATRSQGTRHKKEASKSVRGKKKHSRRRGNIKLDIRQLWTEVRWLLAHLWRAMHLHGKGRINYGFSDPLITATVHGLIAALPTPRELDLQPDYMQGKLQGWADFQIKVYPVQVMSIIVRTAFRPAVRATWWPPLRSALRLSKAH